MLYHLRGKNVLITGGGSGLGRSIALEAASRGAQVMIWDISEEAGEAVCTEIRRTGGAARAMEVDVSDRSAVRLAASRCDAVDVLINNAGVIVGKPLLETSEDEIAGTFDVNTLALYWVTRAFLGGMISRGHGTVVTISSASGLLGVAGQTDYAASKFAAFGFAEALRAEMRRNRTGVTSLTVCPSYVETGMSDGVSTRFSVLLPPLRAEKVARRIARSIEKRHTQLIMPALVRTLPVARAMHVRHFDRLMDLFGASRAMDTFRGHVPPSP